ncbi:MAG: hypothetical protein K2R93_04925 [Gemmatimonadaceae bacterium]|nr:hypothetical protein [Gemmatimonadaceae bacterium]
MKRRPARVPRRTAQPAPSEEAVATLTIDRLAAGGDGVGRLDGLAVFVPRTAPGDTVQVAYRVHGRLGRGRVLQTLTPSADRIAPACPHYVADACGGCQLQHLNADAQRTARRQIVQETLARLARRDVPLPTLTSDIQWGYRGRLTLTIQQRGGRWIGGLHAHDDAKRIFALEQCPIAHPDLVAAWHHVRSRLRLQAMPLANTLRLSLRLDAGDDGRGVAVVVQGGLAWPSAAAFAEAVMVTPKDGSAPPITAVWWTNEAGQTTWCGGRARTETPLADETAADPTSTSDGAEFAPSATEALAFAQVNPTVADALRARVLAAVMQFAPRRVLDAYAGTGPLAEALALAEVDVLAIEADRAGAKAAVARLEPHDLAIRKRVRVVCDLVERALPAPTARDLPEVVVVNPPRRGVDARVTTWLEAVSDTVRGIVYISCNPATLARDLARLPGWRIASVECFDMFPQTAHVETVCVLRRTTDPEGA